MPIEFTSKETNELQFTLVAALTPGGCFSRPATLDDLAAAINAMSASDKRAFAGLLNPCARCSQLVDARNALEIAKAEAERMQKELGALGKEHKAWMGEVESLNRERTDLRAKLEARTQELDALDARLTALESKPAAPATEDVARDIVETIADYLHHDLHPTSLDRLTRIVSAILERHATTKA